MLKAVVLLKDCRPSVSSEKIKKEEADAGGSRNCSPYPTPPPSTSSSSSSICQSSRKRKRITSWDPNQDYEVEKIVGYHRDKKEKMWYLVKWKGYSSEHNTFELLGNLTGCNYLLMNYFEMQKPTARDLSQKRAEIRKSLKCYPMYQKLVKGGFGAEDLREFSEQCLDIGPIFRPDELEDFAKNISFQYKCVVRCLIGMYSHQDPALFLRAQNYQVCLKLINLRRKQCAANAKFEASINRLEKTRILVENDVDLNEFPKDFEYAVRLKFQADIALPPEPILGCQCSEGCGPKSRCCGRLAGSNFAYSEKGKLRFSRPVPIYECNALCACSMDCPNRVVQKGRKIKLCIFRTEKCGWGVKSLENIERGSFVCEYIGELIRDSEAVVRDVAYCRKNLSYLFDLDFNSGESPAQYCIDATAVGNVARFINHSCDPNLVVNPVWVEWLDPNVHRLAFFARRNIKKGVEIHIDYINAGSLLSSEKESGHGRGLGARTVSKIRCMCNASNCREWVFGN